MLLLLSHFVHCKLFGLSRGGTMSTPRGFRAIKGIVLESSVSPAVGAGIGTLQSLAADRPLVQQPSRHTRTAIGIVYGSVLHQADFPSRRPAHLRIFASEMRLGGCAGGDDAERARGTLYLLRSSWELAEPSCV